MLTFKQFIAEQQELSLEDFSIEELHEFMQTEEYEQLDELSKTTLGNYITKATTGTKGVATQTWVAGGATGDDHDAKKKALNTATKRINGIVKAAQKLARESEQLDEGGEKHAYRMGMQHGAKGVKKIDAEKSFGVFAKDYHRGYEQGKDSADWHDDKASKAPLSVRAKYQESGEHLGESAGDLPDSYHKIMVDQGFKKTKTSDTKDGTTHSYSHPDGSEAHYTVRHKTWGGVQIETKHGAARKTGIRTA